MGLGTWIKNIFSGLFGIFGNLFRSEDRFYRSRDELNSFRRAERDVLRKMRLDRDEWNTARNLRNVFGKLPNQFYGESRNSVQREVNRFMPVLARLEKESINVEERELQSIIQEWEIFKRNLFRANDVKDRSQLDTLIRVIDRKFDRLTRDVINESRLDADEARNLNRSKKDLADEEGASEESSEEQLERDANIETNTARKEEAEVVSGEK